MRLSVPWIAAIGTPMVLLTWLFLQSLDPESARQDRLAGILRELNGSEVALQRNALRARAGLLRNYDPLVQAMDATLAAAAKLRELSPAGSDLRARADDIAGSLDVQEGLLERFKTSNALMQNSSAFFDQLAMQVTAGGQTTPIAVGVGSLAMAMLQLTHGSSPEGTARVDANLAALAALAGQSPEEPHAGDAAVLVQHGSMLGGLVTDVDASLRGLLAASSRPLQANYLAQLDRDRAAGERAAAWFRAALYAVALLLAGLLAALGVQLRARAVALRHRSEIERLIAGLSARLIGCAPEDTSRVLGDAVVLLGSRFCGRPLLPAAARRAGAVPGLAGARCRGTAGLAADGLGVSGRGRPAPRMDGGAAGRHASRYAPCGRDQGLGRHPPSAWRRPRRPARL